MDFVECGIACGDGESGEAPRPAPAFAVAAHAAEKQQIENKIFGKVCGLANVVMVGVEGFGGSERKKPVEDWADDSAGIIGGEGICGECEDDTGPNHGRPPSAQPRGNHLRCRHAAANLVELRCWARITPGLFGQEKLLHSVVGGFACNDHVVDMRFAQAGGGDADKPRFFREVL